MDWGRLEALWGRIVAGNTPEWPDGKALEYLIIRGCELSNIEVEYSYTIRPKYLKNTIAEEIDGLVYLGNIPFLVECKDRHKMDVLPIYKLHSQLSRHPPATMGCVFVDGEFTDPAIYLADLLTPQRIILWNRDNIGSAIQAKDFSAILQRKYKDLCKYGLTNYSSAFNDLEV
ncbi:MAG: hypothetical protein EPN21_06030 [Methylococcaceae bacterium]|nr:MAG: hypothetical protein EPN21_06030 [Methylococcaceae bacterium]